MVYSNVINTIGNTPMFQLGKNIYAKAEFYNPGGSIKDRIALSMIEDAEQRGLINKDTIIVEPTSGNTGIGIALVCRMKGYKAKIVMPENMSVERRKLVSVLGAEVILTPAEDNIIGCVRLVEEMKKNNPGIFVPNQFQNPANPLAHYKTTGPEIWRQAKEKADFFISGIGSGGTLQGIGRFLKEQNPNMKIIAVEPKNISALLGHEPGLHQIQGIGDGFIPDILNVDLIDDIIEVTDSEAMETTISISNSYGLLAGISSGANIYAAQKISEKYQGKIVTILADRIERYFSTSLMDLGVKTTHEVLTSYN